MNLAGLSFRDLEYVVRVAELRHFGKAAEACAVSQPTLSTQVRKLEEFLGVEIFERTPRQVLVTGRGQALVDQARLILSEARRLGEIARSGGEPLSGPFRLGLTGTLGPYLMPLLLQPLRERYPGLRLLLQEGLPRALAVALELGELDAVLLAEPPRGADLAALPLFREEFALAIPRDHALAQAARVAMPDITAAELILLGEGHCLRDQVLALFPEREVTARADDDRQASSLELLRQMVAAGLGCSLLPQLAVQVGSLLDDMVAYRRLTEGPGRDVVLYHRPGFARVRDAQLLAALVREVLAESSAVQVAA